MTYILPTQKDAASNLGRFTKPDKANGYCSMHATRIKRHGSPHVVIPPRDRNIPKGPNHPNWTTTPTYSAVHAWIRSQLGPASTQRCVDCNRDAQEWSYIGNDASRYSREISAYVPRCVPCHRRHDKEARGDTPPDPVQDSLGSREERYTPPGGIR